MKSWIVIFAILCILTFSIHEISAIPYQYSVDPLTLTWTTITNAVVLDRDSNGYADALYQYSSTPPTIQFTKILGSGDDVSGTITLPSLAGGQQVLSTVKPDGKMIYVGGTYGGTIYSSSSLSTYNTTSGTTLSNVLNFNTTSSTGIYSSGYVLGYTGQSNEPVLASTYLPTVDGDYILIKNSTQIIYANANDIFNTTWGTLTPIIDSLISGIYIHNSTDFYIFGKTNDKVSQMKFKYPHELLSATFTGYEKSVLAQTTNGETIEFSSDGTKFYVLDVTTDTIYQYNGTTAWRADTFSYGSKSKALAPDTTVEGFTFNGNGTRLYTQLSGTVREYSLSPAWNIATATTTGNTLADAYTENVHWSTDGTKLIVSAGANTRQWNCSTPYLLSSCSGSTIVATPYNVNDEAFSTDGNHLYVATGGTAIGEIQIVTSYSLTGADEDLGTNTYGYSGASIYTNSEYLPIHYMFNNTLSNLGFTGSNTFPTGVCGSTGCIVKNGTTNFVAIKPLTTFTSIGASIDPDVQLYNAGMQLPSENGITTKKTYWYEYLPTPNTTPSDTMKLLHYNILNSALTSDAYRFIFDNGTNKYIMYVTGTSVAYAPFDDTTLDNHSIGFYLPDTITDAMDTALTTAVIPTISFDIVTPTTRLTEAFGGLFALISGYQAETASTVVRIIDSRMDNSTAIIPWTVGLSASQIQLTALIKNAPADSAVMVQDTTSKFLTEKYKWNIDYVKADKTFSVDLPYPKCVDIYIKDLTSLGLPWDYVGNICNTGTMPKTIVYSTNLSFTFYSLPYGVSHTFDQPTTGLTTIVRHDTLPYNYTVKIYDSAGLLQYNNEFQETVTSIDTQLINTTGISLPAMMKVYDVDDQQIYYSTLGVPSYLSQSVAWFGEWFTISGFNLLFMIPIVFGAMFTRNTVGIGTMSTVALIATLTWFGIVPVPDVAIYLMIFISLIGVIAYKKMYD